MKKKAVVVLGMHRSGTSTVSGMLCMLGLDLGRAFMGGNEANPKGFFENYRIMEFNEELFHLLHVNWHNTVGLKGEWWRSEQMFQATEQLKRLIIDDFNQDDLLLFKDPRICVLLPIYLNAFKSLEIEPYFILTYRNPNEVAESLHKRDSFSYPKSFRIWIDHMLKAEKYSRTYPRLFINYHDILQYPLSSLGKIMSAFAIDGPISPTISEMILKFVEPGMNHYSNRILDITLAMEGISRQVFESFEQLISSEYPEVDQKKMDFYYEGFYASFNEKSWPKITVITTIKNNPKALEQTILSVIEQDYPSLEYIVIDRKSEHQTQDVIQKYKYLLSFWASQTDRGKFEAMNTGLAYASGEWVVFLDAGNTFIHQKSLGELIRLFSDNFNVISGECVFNDDLFRKSRSKMFSEKISDGKYLNMPSLFIKTSLAKRNTFNVNYHYLADFDMVLRLIKEKNKIKWIPYQVTCSHVSQEINSPFQYAKERYFIMRSNQNLSWGRKIYHYFAFVNAGCLYITHWATSKFKKSSRLNRVCLKTPC